MLSKSTHDIFCVDLQPAADPYNVVCSRCAGLFSFRHFVSERSGAKGLSLGCVFVFLL